MSKKKKTPFDAMMAGGKGMPFDKGQAPDAKPDGKKGFMNAFKNAKKSVKKKGKR